MEYGIAKAARLKRAWLQNKSGNFIKPEATSGLNTLSTTLMPKNLRVFMPDPEGKDAYPIVTYSWFLLYGNYSNPKRLVAIKDFVRWCLADGQQDSEPLGYIPLAPQVVSLTTKALDSITAK